MKRNSWKALLSVVLLLTMLVSMLPFAAFAEDGQTANTQTEEAAKIDDAPKVEEKVGDAPKADDEPGAAKTDESSGDDAEGTTKDDAAKDETKDESKEAPTGDTENPPMDDTEDQNAQIATLEAETEIAVQSDEQFTVTYKANYKADYTGETVPDDIVDTVTIGETHTVRSSVTFHAPNGWLFVTWNTAADGSGTSIAPNTTLTENTTLYALWEPTPKTPYWAGLTISMSVAPANPKLNEPFTYTVTVTNGTGFDLTGVSVEDTLPANVSAEPGTSDDWTFASSRDSSIKGVSFNGTLAAGSEASFTITAKFETGGVTTATNTARIVFAEYENSGLVGSPAASATATLVEIDWSKLTITNEVVPTTAVPNDTLTYTIKVTNNTGYKLSYLCINDPIPANTTYEAAKNCQDNHWFLAVWGSNNIIESVNAELKNGLDVGASETLTVKVKVNDDAPSGKVENTVTITAATPANSAYSPMPKGVGNSKKAETVVTNNNPGPDLSGLSISMTVDPAIVYPGQKYYYTVTVTNNTDIKLDAVYINDVNPSGYLGASSVKGDYWLFNSSSDIRLTGNGLAPGDYASFNVQASFTSNAVKTDTNKATITSVKINDKIISVTAKEAQATAYLSSGLTISKTVDKPTAKPGDTLIYTVTVNNGTAADLTKLCVDDILPAGVTYDPKNSVPGGWSFDTDTNPGTVKATLSSGLAVGGIAEFKIAATVNAGVSGTITNEAKITEAATKYGSSSLGKSATAETEVLDAVPVNVKVIFNGLKDVSQVPANYKLAGADGNPFLKGEIALGNAEKDTSGQISRTFTTTADVLLGQEYSLSFTQSGYDVTGYICAPGSLTFTQTPTADNKAINAVITLDYTKENLYTYPSVTVRTYFKGLTELPDSFGYKLTCTSAPEEAIAFLTQSPLALTKGTENGVPYMEFSAKNVTLQAGTELTFSFTQSGYDIPGYVCTLGSSTFKFTRSLPTTDELQPIQMNITNTYTQPDWSKLTITKAADKTRAMPGSVVKYTVTVTNNTGVDLSNITVADKLDSDLRYSDSTGDYSTGTGTWTVASLANGKSVALTLTVKLKYALTAGTVIDNTATVTSATAGSQTYDLSSLKISDNVSVTVTSGKGSPRTGDGSNLGLWIAVMAASLVCAGAAVVIYKKRRG